MRIAIACTLVLIAVLGSKPGSVLARGLELDLDIVRASPANHFFFDAGPGLIGSVLVGDGPFLKGLRMGFHVHESFYEDPHRQENYHLLVVPIQALVRGRSSPRSKLRFEGEAGLGLTFTELDIDSMSFPPEGGVFRTQDSDSWTKVSLLFGVGLAFDISPSVALRLGLKFQKAVLVGCDEFDDFCQDTNPDFFLLGAGTAFRLVKR